MTYLPIMWFRGMDELHLRNHDANMVHHVFPMRERHSLEKDEIPCTSILNGRDTTSWIQKDSRKISDIPHRKEKITRSTDKPSDSSHTISDTWGILILRASKIRCCEDFFLSESESHRIKKLVWWTDNYFHRFLIFAIQSRISHPSLARSASSSVNHLISSTSDSCRVKTVSSGMIPR